MASLDTLNNNLNHLNNRSPSSLHPLALHPGPGDLARSSLTHARLPAWIVRVWKKDPDPAAVRRLLGHGPRRRPFQPRFFELFLSQSVFFSPVLPQGQVPRLRRVLPLGVRGEVLLGGDEAGQRRAPEAAAVPETDFGFVQSPERRGGAAGGAGDAGEEEFRSGGGRG